MKRLVRPEWLDSLPPQDPLARQSRDDLQRLNAWMGNPRIVASTLRRVSCGSEPRRLLDLGAGDGRFMLRVAMRLPHEWRGTQLSLLDRQSAITVQTRRALEERGWDVRTVCADVNDWLRKPCTQRWSVTCANLFLHHFPDRELRHLLNGISATTSTFIAVEPRRSLWGLVASKLVGLIGCNPVTRHDAVISVRAGFVDNALSKLWPQSDPWLVEEKAVGPFSHLFFATRNPSHGCSATNHVT